MASQNPSTVSSAGDTHVSQNMSDLQSAGPGLQHWASLGEGLGVSSLFVLFFLGARH